MKQNDFRQIAHSGGKLTIKLFTTSPGDRACGLEWRHTPRGPAGIFSVHVIPPGIAVGTAFLGGLGSQVDPGPLPGYCFQVFIASDTEGMFGQQCTVCGQYWRSSQPSLFCAYCGSQGHPHNFLTKEHEVFIQQFTRLYLEAISSAEDGEYVIDLDAVADAVESPEKPAFYYAEQSQQNKFRCSECGCHVDILGRCGYCSMCGTRNALHELEAITLSDP